MRSGYRATASVWYERRMSVAQLREVSILSGLSDEGLERVARCSAEVAVSPGQVIALPGDSPSGAFVVLEGTVAVELRGRTIELGPGEIVGELALLVPEAGRVARVRAATAARCLSLPRADFLALVESEPSFALALLRELATRLVDTHAAR
jgi:CPA1 family monovalent cation:H+ antiporter